MLSNKKKKKNVETIQTMRADNVATTLSNKQ